MTRAQTVGEEGTRAVAAALAATLGPGAIVLLSGDLGAGKTVFVKGLAHGLGVPDDAVTSPTFALAHQYDGGRLPVVHLDLYRIDRVGLDDVGYDQDLADAGVLVVEWAERLTHAPAGAVRVSIVAQCDDVRDITIIRSGSSAPLS